MGRVLVMSAASPGGSSERWGMNRAARLLHAAIALERDHRAGDLVALQRSRRRRTIPYQGRLVGAVVAEIVIADRDLRRRMGDSLRTDANRSRMVFRLWPFFERVVAHDERAAIWDFDQIAGCTFRAVGDCAANHFGAQCPRFDRMTLPGV